MGAGVAVVLWMASTRTERVMSVEDWHVLPLFGKVSWHVQQFLSILSETMIELSRSLPNTWSRCVRSAETLILVKCKQ